MEEQGDFIACQYCGILILRNKQRCPACGKAYPFGGKEVCMIEQETKIGDFVSDCVNRGSFTSIDMLKLLALIKEVGYKSPEEVNNLIEAIQDFKKGFSEAWAKANSNVKLAKDQTLHLPAGVIRDIKEVQNQGWRKVNADKLS